MQQPVQESSSQRQRTAHSCLHGKLVGAIAWLSKVQEHTESAKEELISAAREDDSGRVQSMALCCDMISQNSLALLNMAVALHSESSDEPKIDDTTEQIEGNSEGGKCQMCSCAGVGDAQICGSCLKWGDPSDFCM